MEHIPLDPLGFQIVPRRISSRRSNVLGVFFNPGHIRTASPSARQRKRPLIGDVLIDDQRDRMMQIGPGRIEPALKRQAVVEPPMRLQRDAFDPLVTVVSVVPLIRSTLAVFSVQTTSSVTEFEAQEFTAPGVAKCIVEPLPSSGTCSIPDVPPSQYPNGTYAVTFVPTVTASELVGTQAASVVVV